MQELFVTYLYHSGFCVAYNNTLVVFDYAPGEQSAPGSPGVITAQDLESFQQVVVLVTHSHADHFDPTIFDWAKPGKVHYVLSDEIPPQWPGARMKPGDKLSVAGINIEAYDSTDLGVSFLVDMGEYRVFHAGDLNLWHWRDVSTLQEIEAAERAFHEAVRPLEGQEIDLAFFPVDPRQGSLYDAGANYFVMAVKPRVLIPMHWQERTDVAQEYVRKNRTRRVEMVALLNRGDSVLIGKKQESEDAAPMWYYQMMSKNILEEREAQAAIARQETDAMLPKVDTPPLDETPRLDGKRLPMDMHALAQAYGHEEPAEDDPTA